MATATYYRPLQIQREPAVLQRTSARREIFSPVCSTGFLSATPVFRSQIPQLSRPSNLYFLHLLLVRSDCRLQPCYCRCGREKAAYSRLRLIQPRSAPCRSAPIPAKRRAFGHKSDPYHSATRKTLRREFRTSPRIPLRRIFDRLRGRPSTARSDHHICEVPGPCSRSRLLSHPSSLPTWSVGRTAHSFTNTFIRRPETTILIGSTPILAAAPAFDIAETSPQQNTMRLRSILYTRTESRQAGSGLRYRSFDSPRP